MDHKEFDCSQCVMCKFERNIDISKMDSWKESKFFVFLAGFMLKAELSNDDKYKILDFIIYKQNDINGLNSFVFKLAEDETFEKDDKIKIIEMIEQFVK